MKGVCLHSVKSRESSSILTIITGGRKNIWLSNFPRPYWRGKIFTFSRSCEGQGEYPDRCFQTNIPALPLAAFQGFMYIISKQWSRALNHSGLFVLIVPTRDALRRPDENKKVVYFVHHALHQRVSRCAHPCILRKKTGCFYRAIPRMASKGVVRYSSAFKTPDLSGVFSKAACA
jgi:hypothetical protein